MFPGFFYMLREEGLAVSLQEWLMLAQALSLGLADHSLSEFYHLARSLLVKSETGFDKYDAAFFRYFGDGDGVLSPTAALPDQSAERAYARDLFDPALYLPKPPGPQMRVIRPRQQGDTPNTAGDATNGGDGGQGQGEINFSGASGGMTAVKMAGQRRYKDYQDDSLQHTRPYETALRALRLLSTKYEGPRDDLDLEATIEETGRNAGLLSLAWERPRKNTIKLFLLLDSIGSIERHHGVVKKLFNAAHKSTQFKEIHFLYFHNCIYGRLYNDQKLDQTASISTADFLRRYPSDCRLLIVGDAQMGKGELMDVGGALDMLAEYNRESGYTWLKRLARHFPYAAWLNPVPEALWGDGDTYATIKTVREIFPMYPLSPEGISKAAKRLLAKTNVP